MIYVYPVRRWFTLQLKRSAKILKVHMSGWVIKLSVEPSIM
jgi:hypothetical protein